MRQSILKLMAALDAARPRHPLEDEGWIYLDPPGRFSVENWRLFLSILGESNYQLLCYTEGVQNGQEFARGQMMLSPAGQENLAAWIAANSVKH